MLFALQCNFNWGQFYIEILKFGYLKNWKKMQIKVGAKIGFGNELGLV